MVRPNGSVIGADNEGRGRGSSFMQQALSAGRGRDRHGVVPSPQCMHDATGLQLPAGPLPATNQRVGAADAGGGGAAPGSENGEPAGPAAPFGLLGLCMREAFGGGPAGCSSANTGLGSVVVDAGVAKSPGLRITWTGMVA